MTERPTPCTPPQALAQLRWVHLDVTHQLQDSLTLQAPYTLGALMRSVFGLALHRHSPAAFECLFGERNEDLKPWWWRPADIGVATWLPAGRKLQSRLSLHSSAVQHLGACVTALGDEHALTLGHQRVPATLVQAQLLGPDGAQPLSAHADLPHWDAHSVWQQAQQEQHSATALRVQARTPLRLKQGGQVLYDAPSLQTLTSGCMGRMQRLLPSGSGAMLRHADKQHWLQQLRDINAHTPQLHPTSVPRYSARQRHAMHIDGLCGHWDYSAGARLALPWLRLAEHLQLGGKTTLGFGVLRVSPPPSTTDGPTLGLPTTNAGPCASAQQERHP